MKKINWVYPVLISIVATLFFMIAGFSDKTSSDQTFTACCIQKKKGCKNKIIPARSEDMLLENFSRHFLNISILNY
ncbi:MAG: hypothetical protein ACRDEB_05755 [Chitinophagaceae bacterium]